MIYGSDETYPGESYDRLSPEDRAEVRHENAIDRAAELEAERDALAVRLAEAVLALSELRACAVECERARLAGDMLTAQLQATVLVQMLIAPRGEGLNGRAEDDLGLRVAGGGE